MKKNKDKKKTIKIIIIVCAITSLLLLLAIVFLKDKLKNKEETTIITQEEREEKVTDYVRPRGESERMKIYISEFIKNVEREQYNLAYKKLHPEFKEKFFQTEESFAFYAKMNYSNSIEVQYENIERYGKYYIISAIITNLEGMCNEVKQKYVIQENGINEYFISFQVQF